MVPAMRSIRFYLIAGALALALSAQSARASLVLHGTRVIFPGKEREVSLQVKNTGGMPALMQSWIDDGRTDLPPDQMQAPFVVMPAVGRVEPDGGAVLRIARLQDTLPQDRESVYWLNVVEVPARPKDQQADTLQLSYRTRIKLFYRPSALTSSDASVASERLTWAMATAGAAGAAKTNPGAAQIEVTNPTPYYVSFSHVEVKAGDKAIAAGGGMVAPFDRKVFPLNGSLPETSHPPAIRYTVINDYGGFDAMEKPLESLPAKSQ